MSCHREHVAYIFRETRDVPDAAAAAAIAFVLARHPRRRNRCKNDFQIWDKTQLALGESQAYTHSISSHLPFSVHTSAISARSLL